MEVICRYKHIVFTFIAMSLVYLNILHFAGGVCGGNVNWMIWPASFFGIPHEIEVGQEMVPLFQDGKLVGWDGQFYYYISNDLLGVKDTLEHVDSPSYRWQRIGLPFCAWVASKIFFFDQVSVTCFVLTQLFIVFFATFHFAKYLRDSQMSILYVLPWLFSFGVQITLCNCLPDAAADSFFICAFLFFFKGRLGWYSLFMTLACLTREGYANIAGMFFLIFLIKSFKSNVSLREMFFEGILLAMPWVTIAAWIFYVTMHFGATPASQAYGILNFPLVDFFKLLYEQIVVTKTNRVEVIGLIIYLLTLVMSIYLLLKLKKKNMFFIGMVPYVFMLGCFGHTVMMDISGYWKGISVLFALLPIFISLDKDISKIIRIICAVVLVIELCTSVYIYQDRGMGFYPNVFANKYQGVNHEADIADLKGKVILNSMDKNNFKMLPLQKYFFYKESATVHITVVNKSASKWSQFNNEQGQYAVYVQGQWFQGDKLVKEDPPCQLTQDVLPGQAINMDMQTVYPSKGEYTYKIRLIQRRHDIAENLMEEKIHID